MAVSVMIFMLAFPPGVVLWRLAARHLWKTGSTVLASWWLVSQLWRSRFALVGMFLSAFVDL